MLYVASTLLGLSSLSHVEIDGALPTEVASWPAIHSFSPIIFSVKE